MFHIPPAVQQPGDNLLTFRFTDYAENPRYLASGSDNEKNPFPGVAGYFSDFTIYLGTERRPWSKRTSDGTATFRLMADGRYLNQKANSDIAFAVQVREGATLRLKGTAKAPKGRETQMSVAVRARSDEHPGWRKLWSERFQIGADSDARPFEADVPLEMFAGAKAEISFRVTTKSRPVNERVTWTQMRLRMPEPESAVADEPRRPIRLGSKVRNVMIIILDAARPDYFGCYGDDNGLTPQVDRFAQEAIVFEEAVSAAPYTLASTSTLFTGLLPDNHGIRIYRQFFNKDLESMPEVFRKNGYYTIALTGHPYISEEHGFARGFDEVIQLSKKEYWDQGRSTMDEDALAGGISKAAAAGKPAFIYAHIAPPHEPYNPPPPFDSRFSGTKTLPKWKIYSLYHAGKLTTDDPSIDFYRKQYMNNMVYADYIAGRLFELLRENGLFDNTMIILTADHGEAFMEHGSFLTADHGEAFMEHGSFGHGTTVADEMILIPLIVRIPSVAPGRVEQQVGNVDLFPTLVELLDLERQGGPLDGRSLAPLFTGSEQPPVDYYYSRSDSDKLVFSLRGRRFKYVRNIFNEELFDLLNDPGETTNVASRHPGLTAWLRQQGMLIAGGKSSIAARDAELGQNAEEQLRHLGYLQ